MKPTDFVGPIAGLIEAADKQQFTLTATQVMDYVKTVVEAIADEFHLLGKTTVITIEQALDAAESIYLNVRGQLHAKLSFGSDREAFTSIYATVYGLMTEDDFKSEAARIIYNLKNSDKFAEEFFYGNNNQPGKSIAPLRSSIINRYKQSYKVDIPPYMVSTILYEHLWSEKSWRTLRYYSYRGSFFSWLSDVASHCVMDALEHSGEIKISRARTPGNTRLALKGKNPEYCRLVFDDMVHIGSLHDILCAFYVECLEPEAIKKKFNLDDADYKLTMQAAEKTLKLALINHLNPYEDVLVDKSPRKIMVSSDFLKLIGQANANDLSPLREVIGVNPDDAEFEQKVEDFLYDFTNNLGWSEEDLYVWQSRNIKNMTTAEVAANLPNRSIPWVYTRNSRLNCRFDEAIRKWWANQTLTR